MKFETFSFAHFFGIGRPSSAETTSQRAEVKSGSKSANVTGSSPATKPAAASGSSSRTQKPTAAPTSATTFHHLLDASLNARRFHQAPMSSASGPRAPRPMTTAEAAAAIISAGEKARGSGDPRRARERVRDMMSRARVDRAAGAAAAIITAAARARGESI